MEGSHGESQTSANGRGTEAETGRKEPTSAPRPRKVAKTLIEGQVPEMKSTRRVGKTLLETGVSQTKLPRKVAKTLLDVDYREMMAAPREAMPAKTEPALRAPSDTPTRRVDKTRLDVDALDAIGKAKPIKNAPDACKSATAGQKASSISKTKRISRTLVEFAIEEAARLNCQAQPVGTAGEESIAGPRQSSRRFVAKTMLDHNMLLDQVHQSFDKKKARAIKLAKERANEPVRQFVAIVADKEASPCPWSWKDGDATERFRLCAQCQGNLYNLDGIELPEAKALIFKRENRQKFTLYKRADGKFMTRDCPVVLKKKRDLILAVIACAVLLLCAIAVATLMPPPPKPVVVDTQSAPDPNLQNALRRTQTPARNQAGTYHYEAGKPVIQTPAPQPASTTTSTTTAPDPDEDGKFWQFSGDTNSK